MGLLKTGLIVGGGALLLNMVAKSQGSNLLEWGGKALSKLGEMLGSLFGGNQNKENQEEQAQKEAIENFQVVSNKEISESISTRQDARSNLELSINEATGKYMNGEKHQFSRHDEVMNDAEKIANDLYIKGFTTPTGEDPRANIVSIIEGTYNKAKGFLYSTKENNAEKNIAQDLQKSGVVVYNKDVANEMFVSRNAILQVAENGEGDFANNDNIEKVKSLMPNAYTVDENGNKQEAGNAIENAMKKLSKDKDVKDALKQYKDDLNSKKQERVNNAQNVMLNKVSIKLNEYLKAEGVEGNNVGVENAVQTVTQEQQATAGEASLADINNKVSAETKEASQNAKGDKATKDSIEQVTSTQTKTETKEADKTKETEKER